MNNIPSKEDFDLLTNNLKEVKDELSQVKSNITLPLNRNQNSDPVLEAILEKGVAVFENWNNGQIETAKYNIDKSSETDIKRFETLNIINKREGIIKAILIITCIIVMCILTAIDKLGQGAVAIITLIIASSLRDSLKDFFKDIYKGLGKNENN